MQRDFFDKPIDDEANGPERTVGLVIPLHKESPTARAMRRIRTIMLDSLAPVIAWSAGKDSSALANLVLNTAREMLAAGERPMPITVVHADTGVEQPEISQLAISEMEKMKAFALKHGIELVVRITQPTLSASWAVRVLGGRGLPAFPDSRADCAQDFKRLPNARAIAQVSAELRQRGEVRDVVVMTGVRQDESIARDQRIKTRGEVAEGMWTNDDGQLRASPILCFSVDDVWYYLGNCAAGVEESYSDFSDVMRICAAAGGDSCVVVADMMSSNQKTSCGSRFGCWACTRVATDRSMDNLIASDTNRYSYLKPLADLRNFISDTQYDWNRRQFVGRTVDSEGFITIGADTYSPRMLTELLEYTLTAQIESGVQIIGYQHLVAIDARLSLYGLQPPFSALKTYFEIVDGKRSHPPGMGRVKKTPTPKIGKIYVGRQWELIEGPNSLCGLRDASRELHGEACGLETKSLSNGNIVIDNEGAEGMEVDEEGAADFVEFCGREMVDQHCRQDHPDWAAGFMTYLGYGTLQIAKGRSSQTDAILRRTRWRQSHNLHGQQTLENLRERCDILFEEQLSLLAA